MKNGKTRLTGIVSLLLAVQLLMLAAGCGGPAAKPDDSDPGESRVSDSPQDRDTREEEVSITGSGTVTESSDIPGEAIIAYQEAKNRLIDLLSNAMQSKAELAFESIYLLAPVMVELTVLPAGLLGYGQTALESGLSVIGSTDIEYAENGNEYKVTYKDSQGIRVEFTGIYDAATDAFVCEVTRDDGGYVYYEYRRMPFGYVGQVCTTDEEDNLILISVHENGGVIGLSTETGKPARLSGGESRDFPTDCEKWYSIDGTAVAGVTSGGEEFEFEYIPAPEE
jgi:hypothetical protein